jgi:hypothetical protein
VIYWGYSQLNSIVKVVERCGDELEALADLTGKTLVAIPNGDVKKILERIVKLHNHVNREALKMIAVYDGAARSYLRNGCKRDPRRQGLSQARALLDTGSILPARPNGRAPQKKGKTQRVK